MYRGLTVIAIVPVFNESVKIGEVVARMPREIVDDVLVVDDGSTDDSAEVARSSGAQVISMDATLGVGAALQIGYDYAVNLAAALARMGRISEAIQSLNAALRINPSDVDARNNLTKLEVLQRTTPAKK